MRNIYEILFTMFLYISLFVYFIYNVYISFGLIKAILIACVMLYLANEYANL